MGSASEQFVAATARDALAVPRSRHLSMGIPESSAERNALEYASPPPVDLSTLVGKVFTV